MTEFDKIPLPVWEAADESGQLRRRALATLRLDRDKDGLVGDTFLILSPEELIIIGARSSVKPRKKKRTPLEVVWELTDRHTESLDGLENFQVEQQISGCILTACRKDSKSPLLLARLSCMKKEAARDFCTCAEQYLRDGKISFEKREEASLCCPKCGDRYPDPERKFCPRCIDRAGIVRRMWFFTKKYRLNIAAVLAAMVFTGAMSILAPYISSGFFFEKVLSEDGAFYGKVLLTVGLLVSVKILSLLANMVNELIMARVVPNIIYDLKKVLFTSIERLSVSFFNSRQTGALMNQVNGDANSIYWFFVNGVPYIVLNVIQTAALIVIMFTVSPKLSIIAVLFFPLVFLLLKLLFTYMNKIHSQRYAKSRSLSAMLSDVLGGVRVVKAFAREKDEIKRFGHRNTELATAERTVARTSSVLFPLVTSLFAVCTAAVTGFGGWMVIRGELSYGVLITFLAYTSMLYNPIIGFVDTSYAASESMTAMQRLIEVMDTQPQVREAESPVSPERLRGDISFCRVEFSYDKTRKIIDGISLDIKAGTTVGIVGHTGAGKSTLANLLIRLYDPTDGEILIDGINVKELSFASLRQNIAIVSQETYLFQGSIFDNIRYAKPDATKEEVLKASAAAGAHDFICKLPDGYYTQIGGGSKELSGGERQRISIARALLRDPSILVLDEATSAMDTRTERKIQAALEKLSRGRTTIMIAHRLSTLRSADMLFVIDNGKISESGSHLQLIREKGLYYKLYMLQYEALKNAGVAE